MHHINLSSFRKRKETAVIVVIIVDFATNGCEFCTSNPSTVLLALINVSESICILIYVFYFNIVLENIVFRKQFVIFAFPLNRVFC